MWWLIACGNPISNDALLADGTFLLALPSEERLRSPSALRAARVGDASVLADAAAAAVALDALTARARGSTTALRDATPDERSDVVRRWESVPAAAEEEGKTSLWYVSATLVRANEAADIEWTLSTSDTAEGPWTEVGAGRHDPGGTGTFDWVVAAVGLDALAVVYTDETEPAEAREVEVVGSALGVPVSSWGLVDQSTMGWTGALAVTTDDERWPGSAVATVLDVGGRAVGELDADGSPLTFDTCWDPNGNTVFQGGSPEVAATGVPGNCSVPALE